MKRLIYKLFGWDKKCKHIFLSKELFDKSIDAKCTICGSRFNEINKDNNVDREKHLKELKKFNVSKSGQEKRRERRKAER